MCVARKGMAPSEFWSMTLDEFWWMIDAATEDTMPCGRMDDSEMAELYGVLKNGNHSKDRR